MTITRERDQHLMMPYQLLDRSGIPINALVDIGDRRIILHSRGGSTGGRPERNPQYTLALDAILDRLQPQPDLIERILLDSRKARQSDGDIILAEATDFASYPLVEIKRQIRKKGRDFGRPSGAAPNQGNSTKQLRFEVALDKDELIRRLEAVPCHAHVIPSILEAGDADVATTVSSSTADLPPSEDDRSWAEGSPRRAEHLRRERKAGLAKLKKEEMVALHGYLFCEKCGLVPIQALGAYGDAVIEVHHTIPVATMSDGHETKLDELQCLCANCHRITHREIIQELDR